MVAMRKVSFDELYEMALNARGCIDKVYLHWSAGTYDNADEDYHVNINGDGDVLVDTSDLMSLKEHTWRRNSNAVGVSMLCCAGAMCWADGRIDFGDYPPTDAQVESMAKVVAVLCEGLGLDINGSNIMTHCEAAEVDGYGPSTTCERWDLWFLRDYDGALRPGGDVIRGKAIWYRDRG